MPLIRGIAPERMLLGPYVREELLARLRQTCRVFADSAVPRDVAVHQARKNMKRARAILRLKADAADVDTVEQQRCCRRIGRHLGELRDADVMLITLHKVVLDSPADLARPQTAALEQHLEGRRTALLDDGAVDPGVTQQLQSDLAAVIHGVELRPVPRLTESILVEAVRRSRRKGESAYKRLGRRASADALHRLRKRAKREFYQRDLLCGVVDMDQARQAQLDGLCDALGWHQDLVVLRRVAAQSGMLPPDLDAQLRRQIRNCRRRARRLASSLYG